MKDSWKELSLPQSKTRSTWHRFSLLQILALSLGLQDHRRIHLSHRIYYNHLTTGLLSLSCLSTLVYEHNSPISKGSYLGQVSESQESRWLCGCVIWNSPQMTLILNSQDIPQIKDHYFALCVLLFLPFIFSFLCKALLSPAIFAQLFLFYLKF